MSRSPSPTELSNTEARRLAIAAQGLSAPRPTGRIDRRHLRRVLDSIGLIQIDSVNVLVRSQELPLFARLGAHPRTLIPAATDAGEMFEYWCHEASHMPVSMHPLVRWRMARARDGVMWPGLRAVARGNPRLVREIRRRVHEEGAIVAGDVRTRSGPKGTWWDWDDGKAILEFLFWTGEIAARRRPSDFARVYMPLEAAIPADVLALPTPAESDARRQLLLLAARSLGVATSRDLFDYHRQKPRDAAPVLHELVGDGGLRRVEVEGWDEPGYVLPGAKPPSSLGARALLSPFDSMVWNRPRAERLFGFRYRIEIYTPAHKRVHGYYVLPFLLGDRLVARVDLKADRQAGTLRVHGAFAEPGTDRAHVANELAAELAEMARWLELSRVSVGAKGNLSAPLRREMRR